MPFLKSKVSKAPVAASIPGPVRHVSSVSCHPSSDNIPQAYTFTHSATPVLRLVRTGPSLASEITTEILDLADNACHVYCTNGYADEEAAIRAGTPRSSNSPSRMASKIDLPVPEDLTLSDLMSEESVVDLERALSSQSQSPDDSTPATRQSGESKVQELHPLLPPRAIASAERWKSLNGVPTVLMKTATKKAAEDEEVASDDLNVGLFRRVIVEDLTAMSLVLGPVVDQTDDKIWQDAPSTEENEQDGQSIDEVDSVQPVTEKRLSVVNIA